MKLEHIKEPLASDHKYRTRLFKYFLVSGGLLVFSLALGTIGYWYFGQQNNHCEKPSWIDAFLTASMILTGMGPVGTIESDAGKIFSALYALYSGVAFLTSAAVSLPLLSFSKSISSV